MSPLVVPTVPSHKSDQSATAAVAAANTTSNAATTDVAHDATMPAALLFTCSIAAFYSAFNYTDLIRIRLAVAAGVVV